LNPFELKPPQFALGHQLDFRIPISVGQFSFHELRETPSVIETFLPPSIVGCQEIGFSLESLRST
jgi:hypothetical protein